MDDKSASDALLDAVHGSVPSEETGLNTHFSTIGTSSSPTKSNLEKDVQVKVQETGSTVASNTSTGTNPFRRNTPASKSMHSHSRNVSAPSPGNHLSSAYTKFRPSPDRASHGPGAAMASAINDGRPRRASSLSSRFPGDRSHRPLDILTAEAKAAHRAPHLRKHHIPGADTIDKLDNLTIGLRGGGPYHHEGPYDAALLARNTSYENSPVAAVERSNTEALRATPTESIRDAVERHHPLDNTAVIPPGVPDQMGRVLHYEEGSNMMIEDGGNFKRWPGVTYHKDDLKGKGEPGWDAAAWYSRGGEGRLVEAYNRGGGKHGDGQDHRDVELMEQAPGADRPRSGSGDAAKRMSGEFRKRFGSLRKRRQGAAPVEA